MQHGLAGLAVGAVGGAAAVRLWGSAPQPARKKTVTTTHAHGFRARHDPEQIGGTRAKKPGHVMRHSPSATKVVRVVLTGGPCAGKSSALEHLSKAASAAGFDVYTAPESATLMFHAGCAPPDEEAEAAKFWPAFQHSLTRLQLNMERSLTRVAESTGRPSILVLDRGLADGKGYCSDELWADILATVDSAAPTDVSYGSHPKAGMSEQYIHSRYDAVIHLVTAADGASKFYKWGETVDDSGNAVTRSESPEAAVALDVKMRECWRGHPRHVIIPNTDAGFTAKLDACTDAILTTARELHGHAAQS